MNETQKRQFLKELRNGAPRSIAMAKVRAEFSELQEALADREFRLDTAEAEADSVIAVINFLQESATNDVKSAIVFLEKRAKHEFGTNVKIEMEVKQQIEDKLYAILEALPPSLREQVLQYIPDED
jgi:hypothetical protein